MFIIVIYTK